MPYGAAGEIREESMQAEKIPPIWSLVYAQVLAYFLTGLAAPVLFFITQLALAMVSYDPNFGHGTGSGRLVTALVLMICGVILALLQRVALRRWLPLHINWLALSGFAMPILIFSVYGLLSRFIVQPLEPGKWWASTFVMQAVANKVWYWSLVSGFIAGLVGGLLYGLIQSILLPWRRRLWWALSALAWAVMTAVVLALQNFSTVIWGGID